MKFMRITNILTKLKNNKIIIVILFLSGLIRLWNLGSIPSSLTPDEASLGYNSYSILKTGKDEHGSFFPFVFKSFGDYKPGLYVYLTTPFTLMFGLNEFSTRLPSGLAGVLTVLLIYLVFKKLLGKELGVVAAFISSVNPWLIYFSRGGWEANVSLTLTLAGIYFFFVSLERSRFLILSFSLFALTLLTYQGAKLSTTIVVALLLTFYWKEFKTNFVLRRKKVMVLAVVGGFLITLPIILSLFRGEAFRLRIFSVFSYPREKAAVEQFLNQGNEKIGSLAYYLYHSEAYNFKKVILGKIFNTFSGKFLFFDGDYENPIHSAPYQGVLLLVDMILLPIGMYAIFSQKIDKRHGFFILWLVLAPLSAALSRDRVSAVRSLNTVVPLIYVLSFGAQYIITWFNASRHRLTFYFLLLTFYLSSFIYFLDAYFIHVPKHNSEIWKYGYKELVQQVDSLKDGYSTIIIEQSFSQPYIYFLYYLKYDPLTYQKKSSFINSEFKGDVGYVTQVGSISFEPFNWAVLRNMHRTLAVVSSKILPPDYLKDSIQLREIKYLNNTDSAFKIIEIK